MKRLLTLIVVIPLLVQISKADGNVLLRLDGHGGESGILVKRKHDTAASFAVKPVSYGIYHNNIFKKRLDSIQKDVPLDYNEAVQEQIETYLASGREDISHEIGLSKYYFPIYERLSAMREYLTRSSTFP
ncbi:MAG: hypothetical protein ACXVJB_05990 [Mucilaginibacter sp.]